MQELEVSIGIIQQGDTYLLQKRGTNPAIGAAGLIGAYGGKIEVHETPLEAVCRELSEETSLNSLAENFKYLGLVEVISDRKHEPVHVKAHVFHTTVPRDQTITSREGEMVRMTKPEIDASIEQLTPATRASFEQLI